MQNNIIILSLYEMLHNKTAKQSLQYAYARAAAESTPRTSSQTRLAYLLRLLVSYVCLSPTRSTPDDMGPRRDRTLHPAPRRADQRRAPTPL